MKTYVLNILLTIGFIVPVVACNNGPTKTDFCKSVKNNQALIGRGKIIRIQSYEILIQLFEVYRGQEDRCLIKVYTQPDFLCTNYLIKNKTEYFGNIGDIVLFHAYPIEEILLSHEEEGQYRSPYIKFEGYDLALQPLIQKGNKLHGNFSKDRSVFKVDEIHDMLKSCEVRGLLETPRYMCGSPNIFPNPIQDQAIRISANIPGLLEIRLYDMRGRLIFTKENQQRDRPISLPMLSAGVYMIIIHTNGAIFKEKLLVLR